MKFASPIPHKKARIEIIPLIDIMFFLLASFMMVSLSQVHMKGMKVNLPTGASGETQYKRITSASRSILTAILTSTRRRSVRRADGNIGTGAPGRPGRESILARGPRHRSWQHYPRARYCSLRGIL